MNFWSLFSQRRRLAEAADQANDNYAAIPVPFQVEWEAIPQKVAQAAGTFLPLMQDPTTPSGPALQSSIRKSNYRAGVWICKLWWNLIPTEMRAQITDWPEGTHRLVFETRADSREEAQRLMSNQIHDHFFGMLRQLELRTFNAAQFEQVKRQREQLADWITTSQGVHKVSQILGGEELK